MLILIILFSLPKTQNYMFQLLLYQWETIKNYQNLLGKDFEDQFTGKSIKQKVRINIQQMSIDIFLNQILLELIDYLFLAYSKIDDDFKGFKTRKS